MTAMSYGKVGRGPTQFSLVRSDRAIPEESYTRFSCETSERSRWTNDAFEIYKDSRAGGWPRVELGYAYGGFAKQSAYSAQSSFRYCTAPPLPKLKLT